MNRWYVVQTKSYQESTAVIELRNQGFQIFYPTYLQQSINKNSGKVTEQIRPLFPSYLFVEFDPKVHPRWKSINGTRGVVGLVGYTEEYLSPVAAGCVEEIIARIDQAGRVPLEDVISEIIQFSPGMMLAIKTGALAGTLATYCNHSENRVTLLLTLLNQKLRVTLPLDAVENAPPSGDRR